MAKGEEISASDSPRASLGVIDEDGDIIAPAAIRAPRRNRSSQPLREISLSEMAQHASGLMSDLYSGEVCKGVCCN